ncbi:MAG: hypothetical protein ACK47R_13190, partial [Planctomycetia bacterium]
MKNTHVDSSSWKLFHALLAFLGMGFQVSSHAAEKAKAILPPEIIIRHTKERNFIGPGMLALD